LTVSSDRRFAQPIRTGRTFEAAIEQILDGIERSRLRAGDRLPTEAELAAMLEISRPTLRQALRVLESAGLLSVRRGAAGGIFLVSDLVPRDELSSAVALEEHAVLDALVARRLLESVVTHHALDMATDDDFEEIRRTIDLLRAHLGDRPAVMRADAMFHRCVVRSAQSHELERAMRGIGRSLAPIRDVYSGGMEQDRHTLRVHELQLTAMAGRDHVSLTHILDEHFCMLEDAVAAALGTGRDELFGRAAAAQSGRR
jgi:GntR family transcriptional repressor for pyruvate dehydrogenase complex